MLLNSEQFLTCLTLFTTVRTCWRLLCCDSNEVIYFDYACMPNYSKGGSGFKLLVRWNVHVSFSEAKQFNMIAHRQHRPFQNKRALLFFVDVLMRLSHPLQILLDKSSGLIEYHSSAKWILFQDTEIWLVENEYRTVVTPDMKAWHEKIFTCWRVSRRGFTLFFNCWRVNRWGFTFLFNSSFCLIIV